MTIYQIVIGNVVLFGTRHLPFPALDHRRLLQADRDADARRADERETLLDELPAAACNTAQMPRAA